MADSVWIIEVRRNGDPWRWKATCFIHYDKQRAIADAANLTENKYYEYRAAEYRRVRPAEGEK